MTGKASEHKDEKASQATGHCSSGFLTRMPGQAGRAIWVLLGDSDPGPWPSCLMLFLFSPQTTFCWAA